MPIEQDQLLDDHNANPASQLTDRQLIGLLVDKEKFPREIIPNIDFEIQRRKLSEDHINTLKSKLDNPELIPTESYKKISNNLLVTVLLILSFLARFFVFFWFISIFPISIRAIKNRFTKGIAAQKSTWRKFEIFMLIIIIALYTIFFLYT